MLLVGVRDLDPPEVPGLLFPAPDGPPLTAVEAAMRTVPAAGRVVAVGVACTWGVGGAARLLAPLVREIATA